MNYIMLNRECLAKFFICDRIEKDLLLFTGPCTPLHGIRADKVVASGIQPFAESDFKWAGCVTMSGRLVRE